MEVMFGTLHICVYLAKARDMDNCESRNQPHRTPMHCFPFSVTLAPI